LKLDTSQHIIIMVIDKRSIWYWTE